jgi:hypothetical protein
MEKIKQSILRILPFEKYLFYLVILLHLIQVYTLKYVVTRDGPAHLYNSNLINHILFKPGGIASFFFEFTPYVNANWTGHILLCILNGLLPALFAEKIIMSLYIILLPLGFRRLVETVRPGAVFSSWLIFPYIFSFCWNGGLYSFNLGLCFLFFFLAWWLKNKEHKIVYVFLWLTVIYISHLFIFGTAVIAILALMFFEKIHDGTSFSSFKKRLLPFAAAALVPLGLFLFFAFRNIGKTDWVFTSSDEIKKGLLYVRPLITLDYYAERIYTHRLFFLYVFLLLSAFYYKWRKKKGGGRFFDKNDAWFAIAFAMLLGYCFIPDNFISGGVIGIRFALLFFIFLLVFFILNGNKYVLLGAGLFSVVTSLQIVKQKYPAMKLLSDESADYASSAKHVREGSVLLPLLYSKNWMTGNLSNYIGIEKDILVLDNYEANQVHFPLRWKPGRNCYDIIGSYGYSDRPCSNLSALKKQTGKDIDYVLLMSQPEGLTDTCTVQTMQQLAEGYSLVYQSFNGRAKLYEIKR